MLTPPYGISTTAGAGAWALYEWHSALDRANASVEAEIYDCAVELVIEFMNGCATLDDLLITYFHPDRELVRLVTELCSEGEILLKPHLLMGASCALRLRQLIREGRG